MSITWIEASAGTGKTYTLVQTVLDLIRSGLPADRILMVTFTEKATAELKTRIRQGLRDAWKSGGEPLLAQALEDLASLSVTTIHGFCRTILTQFPLESGLSFEPEMVDQGRHWRRLLREELRPRLQTLDGALLTWAGMEDEEGLLGLLLEALSRDLLSLPVNHPSPQEQTTFFRWRTDLETGAGPFWDAVGRIRSLNLPEDARVAFGPLFDVHLHARNHKGAYQALRDLAEVDSFRELPGLLTDDLDKALARWDEGGSLWKGKSQPPYAEPLESVRLAALELRGLLESWKQQIPGVAVGPFLAGCARHQLVETLGRPVLTHRSTKELTFHDLIARARDLVGRPEGSALAEAASARWSVVLIDEFQDTDAQQWAIFERLFTGPDHRIFLVGDPKQSIYRFRGADLDVYRTVGEAVRARGAEVRYLDENFRSTAAMVEAVNQMFSPDQAPWDHPNDFRPSRKGAKAIAELVRRVEATSEVLPPVVRYDCSDQAQWHRFLVATVLTLLDGTHALDDGRGPVPLTPADILILVRKKREAWALHRALTRRGVPAAVGGSGGLLKTREAAEVLLFLKALDHPRSLPALRALSWTRLLAGADPDRLAPALAEAQVDRDQGAYLRAFRRVAAALEPGVVDGGGLERLLGQAGGSRLVTNAEHVLELVQERFHRGDIRPGQAALCLEAWMAAGLQEDEVDLRRDTETPTLRILTVHAAKGLEAPVVLHGFPSPSPASLTPWVVDHGVDYLKTPESRQAEERQQRAEDLRLRYVALTRARAHQVFVEPGALPVPEPPSGTDFRASPSVPELPPLQAPVEGLSERHPWVESHSGLWRRSIRDEAPTTEWDRPRSARDQEAEGGHDEEGLPAGPEFGDLVHDILEVVDFRGLGPSATDNDRARANQVVEDLIQKRRAAFPGRSLVRPLQGWLSAALDHPLSLGDAPPLRFNQLAPEDTRRELEFHLPLPLAQNRTLPWGARTITVHPGYLTGRIDLLFRWEGRLYLADWKTNRLTPGQTPEALMKEDGYDLQAQWYWEALNQLCRVQEEPLPPGGVVFLFLRGAGTSPAGVFLSPGHLEANTTLRSIWGGQP